MSRRARALCRRGSSLAPPPRKLAAAAVFARAPQGELARATTEGAGRSRRARARHRGSGRSHPARALSWELARAVAAGVGGTPCACAVALARTVEEARTRRRRGARAANTGAGRSGPTRAPSRQPAPPRELALPGAPRAWPLGGCRCGGWARWRAALDGSASTRRCRAVPLCKDGAAVLSA